MSEKKPCKDKETALKVIETITESMKDGAIKDALEAVKSYIQENCHKPAYAMTPEEREAEIDRLLEKCEFMRDRDNMTPKELKEAVEYYGEGLRCKTAG
jgi:hypothetical protein